MCTLISVPLDGQYRAAIGLNRDEAYGRASAPPRWWPAEGDGVGFVAPVDLVAGGTWFGVNEGGLFVALTNGRQEGAFRHERSRGELVGAALRRPSIGAAVDELTGRDALAYAPCHLLLAQDGKMAYVAPAARGAFEARWLEQGPHTLTNEGLDMEDTPPLDGLVGAAREVSAARAGMEGALTERLRGILATHDGPLARCRHGEGRGTVSSAVLLLGEDLSASRLYFAGGRPCLTPYAEVALRSPART